MTYGEFLASATRQLQGADISSARLDCLVLMEDALGKDRASLLAHLDTNMPLLTETGLNTKIAQRVSHTPLAYIRGKACFYGREFVVLPGVLVPRPETEAMIELLKTSGLPANNTALRVADVGTGSGCLGITAALKFPGSHVELYDIDATALGQAASNAKTHGVRVTLHHEDLLGKATARRYDVILANLPYVPVDHPINQAARHEPELAIFAGQDGLDLYRRFWQQIGQLQTKPSHIFTEALTAQHSHLARLALDARYKLTRTKDLVQEFVPGA